MRLMDMRTKSRRFLEEGRSLEHVQIKVAWHHAVALRDSNAIPADFRRAAPPLG
jgi:hypothetical protein